MEGNFQIPKLTKTGPKPKPKVGFDMTVIPVHTP